MSFVVGAAYIGIAVTEFANSTWVIQTSLGTYHAYIHAYFWWGVADAAIGVIALFAGASILRGGMFGWVVGMAGASFGLIRWMFYIPVSPWLAITIIALDALVIYGLAAGMDWFVPE
jgi:hypothetical protein